MNNKFDYIISLGYNCEVSFRIKDKFGEINSFPYSWAYCCDKKLFLDSLDNLDEILSGDIELLENGMFKCKKFDINFHSCKNKDHLYIDGKPNETIVKNEIKKLKSKINYLTFKMKKLFNGSKRTLFIIKVKHNNSVSDINFVKSVYNKLNYLYKSKNFVLLVVLEEKYITEDFKNIEKNNLNIRSIKCYSSGYTAEKNGDLQGWNRILSNYKLKKTFFSITTVKKIVKKIVNVA